MFQKRKLISLLFLVLGSLSIKGQDSEKNGIFSGKTALSNTASKVKAQEEAFSLPEVGKPMPDFVLDKITNYKTTRATLKDFRGKWLFLDFWFPGCTVCIKSFPKINEWQKIFKDEIEYVLVGLNYKRYENIERLFDSLKIKQHLNLASAFDSTLAKRWGVYSMPDIYIINPDGVLMHRTSGYDMTTDKIRSLISGGHPYFFPKEKKEINLGVNNERPTDVDTKVIMQSVLTDYLDNQISVPNIDYQAEVTNFKRKGYRAYGATIPMLYTIAYTGGYLSLRGSPDSVYEKMYPRPIIERNGKMTILDPADPELSQRYNYSLDVPEAKFNKDELMRQMKLDLDRYFDYEARLEIRSMPVYFLIAEPGAGDKLKSNIDYFANDKSKHPGNAVGFAIRGSSVNHIMNYIGQYLPEMSQTPFLDATGIKHKIDLTVSALMTQIEQVRRELKRNGLDLVKSEKEMTVLILKQKAKNYK